MRAPILLLSTLLLLSLTACGGDDTTPSVGQNPPAENPKISARQLSRVPFYHPANPEKRTPDFTATSETLRLEFFGWSESDDKSFTLQLPEDVSGYDRVMLAYTMGGWNQGPGEWDYTTMLWVERKSDGKRFEIVRAFTPYGYYFDGSWSRTYYIDVTEFLPLLEGETTFRLYYGGWDANDERAHTATIALNYYAGEPEKQVLFIEKLYDSSANSNTGYRSWAYGVTGHQIEALERLGKREIEIPAEVKSLLMRVAISGHGHDQGTFTERTGYTTRNAAEFDENFYTITLNGTELLTEGRIFYSNKNTYPQAGTYQYDRANWGPGLPLYTHFWEITLPDEHSGKLTLDFDLESFESAYDSPKAEGVAQYIIQADLFGYDK